MLTALIMNTTWNSAALRLYPQSPSAGFELLRFGRVINTEHETLITRECATVANRELPRWARSDKSGGRCCDKI